MLDNLTPFAAEILVGHDTQGAAQNIVVVKGTFDLNGCVAVQGKQLPVMRGDAFFDAPQLTGVTRFESDQVPAKPMVDVLVNAFAYAPEGRACAYFDAGIAVGRETRALRVFGPRVWRNRLGVFPAIVALEPALRVPIVYSLAYGGADHQYPEQFSQSNPSGIGFCVGAPPDGLRLPQIEWLGELIGSPANQPSPAGFGCYGRTWQPRRKLLGNYARQELDVPGLVGKMPATFSPAAWNCAHPRMQFPWDLVRPGTVIQLRNLSVSAVQRIVVPDIRIQITWNCTGRQGSVTPAFDTVIIEPEYSHFAVTWRCVLPEGSNAVFDEVRVHLHSPLN